MWLLYSPTFRSPTAYAPPPAATSGSCLAVHKNLIIDRSDIMRTTSSPSSRDNLSSLFDYIIFDNPPAGLLQESALSPPLTSSSSQQSRVQGLDAINQTLMAINRLQLAETKQPYTCLSQHHARPSHQRAPYQRRFNPDQLPSHLHWRHPLPEPR